MREKQIEQKLTKETKKLGGTAYKITSPNINGMPDRLIILPNAKIAFAEIKTTGAKPRPIQIHRHQQLARLGIKTYIIDHPDQIKRILNEIQTTPLPNTSTHTPTNPPPNSANA